MYTSTILSVALATLAAAAPAMQKRDTYYGISLDFIVSPPGQNPPTSEPAPIEINQLTNTYGSSAYELKFDPGVAINVDLSTVECRAYKDAAGVEPGSAPFTLAEPALLSTNPVEVGSILCYIVEPSAKMV